MRAEVYFAALALLVAAAFVVFRVLARRDYRRKGRLTLGGSFLQLLVWTLYMCFPYLYNPPGWEAFWSARVPVCTPVRVIGVVLVVGGVVAAFGTMAWFGLPRAFGQRDERLVQRGPYRLTRNPQLVGGSLFVIGIAVLWPSWYAVGWVALAGVVAHLMVIPEEEHLRAVFGDEFAAYCTRVPRWVGRPSSGGRRTTPLSR